MGWRKKLWDWWRRPSVSAALRQATDAAVSLDGFEKDWKITAEMRNRGWEHDSGKGRTQDEKAYAPCSLPD